MIFRLVRLWFVRRRAVRPSGEAAGVQVGDVEHVGWK